MHAMMLRPMRLLTVWLILFSSCARADDLATWREQADAGDLSAMTALAKHYLQPAGDAKLAKQWLSRLSAAGAEGAYQAGDLLFEFGGFRRPNAEAMAHFRRAAEAGHVAGMREYGEHLAADPDAAVAAGAESWLARAADAKDAKANLALSRFHFFRVLETQGRFGDWSESRKRLEQAATLGEASAMAILGRWYLDGWAGLDDIGKGTELLRAAFESGDVLSYRELDRLLCAGNGRCRWVSVNRQLPSSERGIRIAKTQFTLKLRDERDQPLPGIDDVYSCGTFNQHASDDFVGEEWPAVDVFSRRWAPDYNWSREGQPGLAMIMVSRPSDRFDVVMMLRDDNGDAIRFPARELPLDQTRSWTSVGKVARTVKITLSAEQRPDCLLIQAENIALDEFLQQVAKAGDLRVEGADRLGKDKRSFRFNHVAPMTILNVLAAEAGLAVEMDEHRRVRFSVPAAAQD